MDLMQLIQWLTGRGQDEEELARQMKLAKMKQEQPWLFKSDSVGYAPDDMMRMKNPNFMDIMDDHQKRLALDMQRYRPTGKDLNDIIMQGMNNTTAQHQSLKYRPM